MKVQEELLHYPSVSIGVGVRIGIGGIGVNKNVKKFYVKVYTTLYFLTPAMDFVYIWYNYRCWSKIFLGTIHTPTYDLEVKVIDLEILW